MKMVALTCDKQHRMIGGAIETRDIARIFKRVFVMVACEVCTQNFAHTLTFQPRLLINDRHL